MRWAAPELVSSSARCWAGRRRWPVLADQAGPPRPRSRTAAAPAPAGDDGGVTKLWRRWQQVRRVFSQLAGTAEDAAVAVAGGPPSESASQRLRRRPTRPPPVRPHYRTRLALEERRWSEKRAGLACHRVRA